MSSASNSIINVGASDQTLDLFENQYIVPNGISYNSYLIFDEKTVLMDTVDSDVTEVWMYNIEKALDGRTIDYLVISHMESDHSANIMAIIDKYPNIKIVGNMKTFVMIKQFFGTDFSERAVIVKEGDTLNVGAHTLQFFAAPMVHWPEVMMTYEQSEKILFSADAFGKFGTLDTDEPWIDEARRYYINIVGKYGAQVQAMLKKASALSIQKIYPLHGPILTENLDFYTNMYDIWSSYKPECNGTVIAYASIHGNTESVAKKFADILKNITNEDIVLYDLSRADMSKVIADAFKYDKMVLASVTYDGVLFPCMENLLYGLKNKGYKNRKVGLIENGSWAPLSGNLMRGYLEEMKNIQICEKTVTVKSAPNDQTIADLNELAHELLKQ